MLDQAKDLLNALKGRVQMDCIQRIEFDSTDKLYCPSCRKPRPMHISLVTKYSQLPQHLLKFEYETTKYHQQRAEEASRKPARFGSKKKFPLQSPKLQTSEPPALFFYKCLQCEIHFSVLLYLANNEPVLIVLPTSVGGLATPHTPPDVAYYANEGHKAACVNAVAVAVAMFRAAIEKLLTEQGYTGSLKQKVMALQSQITSGSGPTWAKYLKTDLIEVLKELGDSSMHAGDMVQKAAYDRIMAARAQLALTIILHAVYEKGEADASLLAQLLNAINSL